ncbi:MAG: YHYH protein [Planktomarina sp.]
MKAIFVTVLLTALPTLVVADDAKTLKDLATYFGLANISGPIEIVDCTLSKGTQSQCFRITTSHIPATYEPGPWCPTSTTDTADAGGIWLESGKVLDVDGAFITRLTTLYDDPNWQLYDANTGEIRYTKTLEACQLAARPDVAEEYQNHCVQCLPEHMPDGHTVTYTIPITPENTWLKNDIRHSGSGVAHNGVRLDAAAPLDAILSAYTVAPFDDCGGHVNPNVGYHYHAVTDCLQDAPATFGGISAVDALTANLGPQIGIAMDGYPIFDHTLTTGDVPDGLDKCNGTNSDGLGYRYHAGAAGSNAILGCLKAETGCVSTDADAYCDASARPPRP